MVGPIAEKSVWFLFPIFVSINQFSNFWVMSYENWKHILYVFSFQNSISSGIFVIKHTRRDLLSEQQPQLLTFFFLFWFIGFGEFSFHTGLLLLLLFFSLSCWVWFGLLDLFLFSFFRLSYHRPIKNKNKNKNKKINDWGNKLVVVGLWIF